MDFEKSTVIPPSLMVLFFYEIKIGEERGGKYLEKENIWPAKEKNKRKSEFDVCICFS